VSRRTGICLLLFAATVVAAPAATASAAGKERGFELSTWSIPVTTPDETGGAVAIDTDVYMPTRRAPRGGYPFVMLFHGGGGEKSNPYDTKRARRFAKHGYASLIYSARGHGDSGGQTTAVGPAEIRDLFDVAAWALEIDGAGAPDHPDFELNARRIALWGISQGGLHTNLAQAHANDPDLNPYGIRFRALLPGNTPDRVFDALVHNEVVKLSFGVGLIQTYLVGAQGQVGSNVAKWIATSAADVPGSYGAGPICERGEHDTPSSTMKHDLAERSIGCFMGRMRVPFAWAQAFDDELFTPQMAVDMYHHAPAKTKRLYLSTGGHGAPGSAQKVERDRLRWQMDFLGHRLRGRKLDSPPVIYWRRNPAVPAPSTPFTWDSKAWRRDTAKAWPPAGTRDVDYQLSADETLVRSGAQTGSVPLAPLTLDIANDPVAIAVASATPLGAAPVQALPSVSSPGLVAGFQTEPLERPKDLLGSTRLKATFTPLSPDAQLILRVYDLAADGTATLLGRDATGMRLTTPGQAREVSLRTTEFAARIAKEHSVLALLTTADAPFYKVYPGSLGGLVELGPSASLTVPLKPVR
jgi:ABC-2 type transport system ATP-binding protein